MTAPKTLKKFVKNMCIVTKHYYERENARLGLISHIDSKKSKNDISLLDKKINFLLEKEAKVAELGLSKKLPYSVRKKIVLLENQLEFLKSERDKLEAENIELRSALRTNFSGDERSRADADYQESKIGEINQKIALLEKSYRRIEGDRSINPVRLRSIKEKLESYKKYLANMTL